MAHELGCGSLLVKYYDSSVYKMVKSVYHEHDWKVWKFAFIPGPTARDPTVIKEALQHVEKELKLSNPEDWYQVTELKLKELGVLSILLPLGGLPQALRQYIPDFTWEDERFAGARLSGLKSLGVCLKALFPKDEVVPNFNISPGFAVSYYIPTLKLAFDYQSYRSYELEGSIGHPEVVFKEPKGLRDEAKRCGITLIFIPFWWDRSTPTLSATILRKVPNAEVEGRFRVSADPNETNAHPIPLRARVPPRKIRMNK